MFGSRALGLVVRLSSTAKCRQGGSATLSESHRYSTGGVSHTLGTGQPCSALRSGQVVKLASAMRYEVAGIVGDTPTRKVLRWPLRSTLAEVTAASGHFVANSAGRVLAVRTTPSSFRVRSSLSRLRFGVSLSLSMRFGISNGKDVHVLFMGHTRRYETPAPPHHSPTSRFLRS